MTFFASNQIHQCFLSLYHLSGLNPQRHITVLIINLSTRNTVVHLLVTDSQSKCFTLIQRDLRFFHTKAVLLLCYHIIQCKVKDLSLKKHQVRERLKKKHTYSKYPVCTVSIKPTSISFTKKETLKMYIEVWESSGG